MEVQLYVYDLSKVSRHCVLLSVGSSCDLADFSLYRVLPDRLAANVPYPYESSL